VAKDRERLAVSNQKRTEFIYLKKLNEVDCKEQYLVDISSRFSAGENLDAEVHINRAWGAIRENIILSAKDNVGHYELKGHRPWFDETYSKLLHQRQAKLQWLQDPSEINRDNLNNVGLEASRHLWNK
jgi:hypothetical protein